MECKRWQVESLWKCGSRQVEIFPMELAPAACRTFQHGRFARRAEKWRDARLRDGQGTGRAWRATLISFGRNFIIKWQGCVWHENVAAILDYPWNVDFYYKSAGKAGPGPSQSRPEKNFFPKNSFFLFRYTKSMQIVNSVARAKFVNYLIYVLYPLVKRMKLYVLYNSYYEPLCEACFCLKIDNFR